MNEYKASTQMLLRSSGNRTLPHAPETLGPILETHLSRPVSILLTDRAPILANFFLKSQIVLNIVQGLIDGESAAHVLYVSIDKVYNMYTTLEASPIRMANTSVSSYLLVISSSCHSLLQITTDVLSLSVYSTYLHFLEYYINGIYNINSV